MKIYTFPKRICSFSVDNFVFMKILIDKNNKKPLYYPRFKRPKNQKILEKEIDNWKCRKESNKYLTDIGEYYFGVIRKIKIKKLNKKKKVMKINEETKIIVAKLIIEWKDKYKNSKYNPIKKDKKKISYILIRLIGITIISIIKKGNKKSDSTK